MSRKSAETKGPVGEEPPRVALTPDIAALIAAQAQTNTLLGQMGQMILAAQQQQDALAARIAQLEQGQAVHTEALMKLQGILQQFVKMRVL